MNYPRTSLAERLSMVARLIRAGLGSRVYYAIQSGYDTHSVQARQHADLLAELAGAVRAFHDDLRSAGLDNRVAVLCFSEFGRRVEENGSSGTDHGTAGPVFLVGSRVQGGLVGTPPSLVDLDAEGDLKMTVDFRRVYASVLEHWLGISRRPILGESYAAFSLQGVTGALALSSVPGKIDGFTARSPWHRHAAARSAAKRSGFMMSHKLAVSIVCTALFHALATPYSVAGSPPARRRRVRIRHRQAQPDRLVV